MQTSFNPADILRAIRSHRWSFYDGQYLILINLGIFSLSAVIEEPGAIIKTLVAGINAFTIDAHHPPVFAAVSADREMAGAFLRLQPAGYENLHGLAPANYSIQGSPDGLPRIDELFSWNIYTSNFTWPCIPPH
ncbi:Phosphatidylinositol:ceramide phosphoinositol transferase (IPC synthase) [Rhizina undulata]